MANEKKNQKTSPGRSDKAAAGSRAKASSGSSAKKRAPKTSRMSSGSGRGAAAVETIDEQSARLGKELGLTPRKREPKQLKHKPAEVKPVSSAKPAKSNMPAPSNAARKAVSGRTKRPASSLAATSSKDRKKPENIKIIPIGGLNEIGKNMTVIEYRDQILIIDCGMSFPEDDMFGVDVVIPDFTYVINNASKVRGIIITHGHEDHIGGLSFLLQKIDVPVYGTPLALALIRSKIEEHGITGDLRPIHAGEAFNIGDFRVEAIRTTHSIADALCFCIETDAARLFHTGDFKIDYTPIDGEQVDLASIAEIGRRGVDIMLADSTNATRRGFTPSEKVVGKTLDGIIRDAQKRIIIATFSSNVHRVQTIIELSLKYGRKIATSGRSMDKVIGLARELGYLKFPDDVFVDLKNIKHIPDRELTIITTGSQGEPMSALARMAEDEHRSVKLKKGDTVILSSTPVPGNEKTVSHVINKLYEKEINVIYNDVADIHVSGHASQEDLKLMHTLIKPKYFMPVHGEYRHLVRHALLAEELGIPKNNIFILSNGDQLTVDKKKAIKFRNVVQAGAVMVDGMEMGELGSVILKDRKMLSESGLIIISAAVDRSSGTLVSGPEIVSRGFIYVKDNEELVEEMRNCAREAIENSLYHGNRDWNSLKNDLKDVMRKFVFRKTKRSPMLLPIFLEV